MKLLLQKILYTILLLRRKLIHAHAKEHLGIDASPVDRASDELGCAESVTEILNKAVGFPIITGTWTLDDYLMRDKRFSPTQDPQPGDILVSPTGKSNKRKPPFVGHTGIVGENGIIYSNDSYSGKWMANYSIETWKERYSAKGGYPMFYYRLMK